MSKTVNRRPYSVNLPKADDVKNYFFNQNTFKGIIEDKNFLETDPTSFSDAKNTYVDSDGVLKSRPSLDDASYIMNINNATILKVWEFSELGHTIVYFNVWVNNVLEYRLGAIENNSIVSLFTLGSSTEPIPVQVKNDIYVFANTVQGGRVLKLMRSDDEYYVVNADIYIPITSIKYGESSVDAESKNVLTESYITRYLISDVDSIPKELQNTSVSVHIDNDTYNVDRFSKYSIFNKFSSIRVERYLSQSGTKFYAGVDNYIINVLYNDNVIVNYFFDNDYSKIQINAYSFSGNLMYTSELSNPVSLPVLCDNGTVILLTVNNDNAYVVNKINVLGQVTSAIVNNITSSITYSSGDQFFVGDAINEREWVFVSLHARNNSGNSKVWHTTVYEQQNAAYLYSQDITNITVNSVSIQGYACKLYLIDDELYVVQFGKVTYSNVSTYTIIDNQKLIDLVSSSSSMHRYLYSYSGYIKHVSLLYVKTTDTTYGPYQPVAILSYTSSPTTTDIALMAFSTGERLVTFYDDNIHVLMDDGSTISHNDIRALELYNDHSMKNVYANWNIRNNALYKVTVDVSISDNKITITEERSMDLVTYPDTLYLLSPTIPSTFALGITTDPDTTDDFNPETYTNYVSQYKPLIVDLLTTGNNNSFIPDHESYLSEYYFSQGNKLYVSSTGVESTYKVGINNSVDVSIKHEGFEWYLPESNTNEFNNDITYLHPISATEMAVFFENEVYYTTYDTDMDAYRAYKTMQQVGLVEGAEVITTFDTKYVVFSSQRGLVAMSYQQFITSTEQALTFLSDTIQDRYKDFNKTPVKLYKYDYWIVAYHENFKGVYLFDTRNSSWWYWESNKQIRQLYTHTDTTDGYSTYPHILDTANSLHKLNRSELDYNDEGDVISWYFTSQQLPFALNYYKHIVNMTFVSLYDVEKLQEHNWSDYRIGLNLRTLIYRTSVSNGELKPQPIDYSIDFVRTYVLRLNYSKVEEFQYQIESDDTSKHPLPFSLVNLTIKYRIGSQVR